MTTSTVDQEADLEGLRPSTVSKTEKAKHHAVHTVAPEDRVPLFQKCAYAMGVVSDHYAVFALSAFLMPFFNVTLGLSASMVALAMGLARFWDAINDPLVGSISDNWRSRFGRRKPFLFMGAILCGIVFPLIWLVPSDWSHTWMFIWLCAILLIYYTCYSLLSVPYESLGMELTPDYQERTNIYAVRTYVQRIFDLGIPWLLPLATASVFGSLVFGVRVVSIGVGLMIIFAGVLPAIFCVERYAKVASQQEKENPIKGLVSLVRNKPFWIVMGAIAIYLFGLMTNSVLGFYIHTYYVCGGDIQQGAVLGGYHGTLGLVFAMLGAVLIQWLSRYYEKKTLLLVCVAILFISILAWTVTYLPGHPYLTLVTRPFIAMAETGFWVLIISMRADVGDWDELLFGRRREGLIAATGNWLVKLSMTVAVMVGGLLLDHVIRFDSQLEANQPESTLIMMKVCYITVQSLFTGVVFLILLFYPLTREQLHDVRRELEERRSVV